MPLQKFSPAAIETFLKIERPSEHDALPEDDSYETIGQFYEAIEVALADLAQTLGERTLFCGDPARQVTDEFYYGGSGRIIAVHDRESALSALGEIVEQGEGLDHAAVWDGDRDMFHPEREEVAHYFRFQGDLCAVPLRPIGLETVLRRQPAPVSISTAQKPTTRDRPTSANSSTKVTASSSTATCRSACTPASASDGCERSPR